MARRGGAPGDIHGNARLQIRKRRPSSDVLLRPTSGAFLFCTAAGLGRNCEGQVHESRGRGLAFHRWRFRILGHLKAVSKRTRNFRSVGQMGTSATDRWGIAGDVTGGPPARNPALPANMYICSLFCVLCREVGDEANFISIAAAVTSNRSAETTPEGEVHDRSRSRLLTRRCRAHRDPLPASGHLHQPQSPCHRRDRIFALRRPSGQPALPGGLPAL